MTSSHYLYTLFFALLQTSSMTNVSATAAETDLIMSPSNLRRRRAISFTEKNQLQHEHSNEHPTLQFADDKPPSKLTSFKQLFVSGEVEALSIEELQYMFENHEYVGLMHFVKDQQDEERQLNKMLKTSTTTASTAGARAIITTQCLDENGNQGVVYCDDVGIEQCLSYEALKEHPYNRHNSGRFGFCYDFLPLEEELKTQIAQKYTDFALSLFETCLDKNEHCL